MESTETLQTEKARMPVVVSRSTKHRFRTNINEHLEIIENMLGGAGVSDCEIDALPAQKMGIPCKSNTPTVTVKSANDHGGYIVSVRPPGASNDNRLAFVINLPLQYRDILDLEGLQKAADEINRATTSGRRSDTGEGEENGSPATEPTSEEILAMFYSLVREDRAGLVPLGEIIYDLTRSHPSPDRERLSELAMSTLEASYIECHRHNDEIFYRTKHEGNLLLVDRKDLPIVQALVILTLEDGSSPIDPKDVVRRGYSHLPPTVVGERMRELQKNGVLDNLFQPNATRVYTHNGNLAAGRVHEFFLEESDLKQSQGVTPVQEEEKATTPLPQPPIAIVKASEKLGSGEYKILLAYWQQLRAAEPHCLEINAAREIAHTIIGERSNEPLGPGTITMALGRMVKEGVLKSAPNRSYGIVCNVVTSADGAEHNLDIESEDEKLLNRLGIARNVVPQIQEKTRTSRKPAPEVQTSQPAPEPAKETPTSAVSLLAKAFSEIGDLNLLKQEHEHQIADSQRIITECEADLGRCATRKTDIQAQLEELGRELVSLTDMEVRTTEILTEEQKRNKEAVNYETERYQILKFVSGLLPNR